MLNVVLCQFWGLEPSGCCQTTSPLLLHSSLAAAPAVAQEPRKRGFREGVSFAQCTPLLAAALWVPNVLLGPMPWVFFVSLAVSLRSGRPRTGYPWILTTLGCPGTPDPRNSSVEKFPSWGIPRSRAPWAEPTGMVNLSSGGAQELIDRNSSGQGFLRIQGWWESKGGSWLDSTETPFAKTPLAWLLSCFGNESIEAGSHVLSWSPTEGPVAQRNRKNVHVRNSCGIARIAEIPLS